MGKINMIAWLNYLNRTTEPKKYYDDSATATYIVTGSVRNYDNDYDADRWTNSNAYYPCRRIYLSVLPYTAIFQDNSIKWLDDYWPIKIINRFRHQIITTRQIFYRRMLFAWSGYLPKRIRGKYAP